LNAQALIFALLLPAWTCMLLLLLLLLGFVMQYCCLRFPQLLQQLLLDLLYIC
jgi:hypothetical protein